MTYGIFQEYYLSHWTFHGSKDTVGIIGTTSNGVMYLSMPFLFTVFSRRFVNLRRISAFCGLVIACIGFLTSSFSTEVWHLVITQGILVAFGCTLMYSPTTLSLSEYFSTGNRAIAYGIVLSCKNITGSVCPFLMQYLLDHFGFRTTIRIWTIIVAGTGIAVLLIPIKPSSTPYRSRRIHWDFLHHNTFYVYGIAIILQSSGYGLPQTYLNSYATSVASLSATSSALLITLFNAPGIISSSFFGFLIDNKRLPLSANVATVISALSSAMAVFLLWGFTNPSETGKVLLILFALIYGFFAGGYSATWGGIIKEMEQRARDNNEPIDTGMIYGLFNGARGLGFVGGGFIGVQLLKVKGKVGNFGYGTIYGPLIIYTGLATAFGGWTIVLRCRHVMATSMNLLRGMIEH